MEMENSEICSLIKDIDDQIIQLKRERVNLVEELEESHKYWSIRCVPDNTDNIPHYRGVFSSKETTERFIPKSGSFAHLMNYVKMRSSRSGSVIWSYSAEPIHKIINKRSLLKLDERPDDFPYDEF